jgi:ATP synthase protein I
MTSDQDTRQSGQDQEESSPGERHKQSVARHVGRKAERRLKARQQRDRGLWFGLGMFGLVGWSVAVPTLLGVMLGLWLDSITEGDVSWTLTFLILGVMLGCLNAWYWVRRESAHD